MRQELYIDSPAGPPVDGSSAPTARASIEGGFLITRDKVFRKYGVTVVW